MDYLYRMSALWGSAAGACWWAGGGRGDHRNGGVEGGSFSFDPKGLNDFFASIKLKAFVVSVVLYITIWAP